MHLINYDHMNAGLSIYSGKKNSVLALFFSEPVNQLISVMLIISKNHYCHDFITEILTSPSSKLLMKKIRLQIETLMTVKIVFEHAKVHFVEVWPDYKIQTT